MDRRVVRWITLVVSCAVAGSALVAGWCWIDARRQQSVEFRRVQRPSAPRAPPRPGSVDGIDVDPETPEQWSLHLDEAEAAIFYGFDPSRAIYDPWTASRGPADFDVVMPWDEYPGGSMRMRTNSIGLREDGELAQPPAALRILVAGDSHTCGVVPNRESFANVLEARLVAGRSGGVEVLNAGFGGYSFINYLGTLYKFRDFEPRVFVVTVFGGNDFSDLLGLYLFHAGRPWPTSPPERESRRALALPAAPEAIGQGLDCVETFRAYPQEKAGVLDMALRLSLGMRRAARACGARIVFVYLPSPFDLFWREPTKQEQEGRQLLALEERDFAVFGELADAWIAGLAAEGQDVLDLRARFRQEEDPPYWRHDFHLNVRGHALVAEALEPVVKKLLE